MTVIAYRDGIMAGDSCWSDGSDGDYGGLIGTMTNKVHKLPSGALYGGSGAVDDRELLMLLVRVKKPTQLPTAKRLSKVEHSNVLALLVLPDRSIWKVSTGNGEDMGGIEPIEGPIAAVGSGSQLAIGAMAMGASAAKAVHITCAHHVFCRPPVTSISFHDR